MAKCPGLIVVGGGLAGLLLAAHAGERFGDLLNITVIERALPKAPEASLDTRATALSRGSKELLESWGFWAEVSASAKAIENIHVSRKSRFGSALLQDDATQNEPMGWVVENALLQAALLERCEAVAVEVIEGHEVVNFKTTSDRPVLTLDDERQLEADLVIISDGASLRYETNWELAQNAMRHRSLPLRLIAKLTVPILASPTSVLLMKAPSPFCRSQAQTITSCAITSSGARTKRLNRVFLP